MSTQKIPDTLSRPLASRINGLPAVSEQNDNPTIAQGVMDAAIKALDDGKTHYTDRPGILPLRQWVCDHLKGRYGVDLSPDEVTITCGRTEARFVTFKVLAQPGTPVFCPGDSSAINGMAQLAGATIVDSPDNPAAIRLVYLTSKDRKAVAEQAVTLAMQHNWWIAWDMLDQNDDYHPAQNADAAARIISLGSLSRQLPGWRIGWFAGSEVAGKLRSYKQSMTICSTSISQWAALGLAEQI